MLFSVVADSLRVRVFWNNKLSQTFRGVALAIAILEALLLLVESLQKKRFVGNQDRLRGPEEFGGLFSQTLFLWLNRLLRQGYAHDLSVTDLYPINDGISSERLGLQFWNWWEQRASPGTTSCLPYRVAYRDSRIANAFQTTLANGTGFYEMVISIACRPSNRHDHV